MHIIVKRVHFFIEFPDHAEGPHLENHWLRTCATMLYLPIGVNKEMLPTARDGQSWVFTKKKKLLMAAYLKHKAGASASSCRVFHT